MEYVIGAIVIILILNQPDVKGVLGDLASKIMLASLKSSEFSKYKKVKVKGKDDKELIIDQVIVSKYGVFAINKDRHKGMIFGNENQPEWNHILYFGKKKFDNPIPEAKEKGKSLVRLLGINNGKIFPVVAFSSGATLKKIQSTTMVVYTIGLTRLVKGGNRALLSDGEIEKINETLKGLL